MVLMLNIAIAIQVVKTIAVGGLTVVGRDPLQRNGRAAWEVMKIWTAFEVTVTALLIAALVLTNKSV